MRRIRLIIAAFLVLGPIAGNADLVTWELSGLIDDTDRLGVNIGDAFSVQVNFDTDAALLTTQTGGRFDPGARYEYDPSGMSFVVNIPGLIDELFTPGDGANILWLRDNSGDRADGGEPAQVDGLSFALEDTDFIIQAGIFRGSILDLFDGPGLPSTPDPRLVDLEISDFAIVDSDGFATGRISSITSSNLPSDRDGDGVPNIDDNCPNDANPGQTDTNGDGFGDACVPASSYISKGASIGLGTEIGENVTINRYVSVGENTTVGDNTTVNQNSMIGTGVVIGSDVSIGQEVTIDDDVRIGDRTIINRNVFIGEGAFIGTDCNIGRGATILAGTVIPDNTVIGKNAVVGP